MGMAFKAVFLALFLMLFLAVPTFADTLYTYSDSSLTTRASFFKNNSAVYIQVSYVAYNYTGGTKNATIVDSSDSSNTIVITTYDNGVGPGDIANDGKYTASFTVSTDPSSNTTKIIQLADVVNATISAADTNATAQTETDYTQPSINIISPVEKVYGPNISVISQIFDATSGLGSASFWLQGITNTSSTTMSCASLGGGNWNCTYNLNTSGLSPGNYTIWVSASDKAANSNVAYKGNISISNQLATIYADYSHPYHEAWFVNVSDSFTITGNVTDINGNLVAATVTVTASLPGKANIIQTINYTGVERFSPTFTFSGASVGKGVVTISAVDTFGNRATWWHDIYVTRYLSDLVITLKTTQDYWNEKDALTVQVKARDSKGDSVYKANVSVYIPDAHMIGFGDTDVNGNFEYKFEIPQSKLREYKIDVFAYSPLNKSALYYNGTAFTLKVEYVDINLMWLPLRPSVGETVFFDGYLNTSFGDNSLVKNRNIQYYVYKDENMSHKVQDWKTIKTDANGDFSFSFTPNISMGYWFMINVSFPWTYNTSRPAFTLKSYAIKTVDVTPGAVANVTLLNMNVTDFPSLLKLDQGSTKEFNFTIKNIGTQSISGFSLILSLPSGARFSALYMPSAIAPGQSAQARFSISVENISITTYSSRIVLGSREGASYSSKFTLQVGPNKALQKDINITLVYLQNNATALEQQLSFLLRVSNTTNANTAWTKLQSAKSLINESLTAAKQGDWFYAYKNQNETALIISQVQTIASAEQEDYNKSTGSRNIIIVVIIIVIILTLSFWYLWLPTRGIPSKALPQVRKDKKVEENNT